MKIRFTELPIGSCYLKGKKTNKKVEEERSASIGLSGKVNTRKMKQDPEVEPTPCPLRYLGVGLRRHPDAVVEIGDGNLLKKRRKS